MFKDGSIKLVPLLKRKYEVVCALMDKHHAPNFLLLLPKSTKLSDKKFKRSLASLLLEFKQYMGSFIMLNSAHEL